MKNIYAVENGEQLRKFQLFAKKHQKKFADYLDFLKAKYAVTELPNAIVWTSAKNATNVRSSIPLPAYTNDFRTVFCPDRESWREIYLKQLDGLADSEVFQAIRLYYETGLTENHILQILGHEFVHHSEFFPEDDYESGIWFEEGMCEYISRKFFLTEEEFDEEVRINALLVNLFRDQYGQHSLESFGAATYSGNYASIFYEYWRSFLAVRRIVERYNGEVSAVFNAYQHWLYTKQEKNLLAYFNVEI